MHAFSWQKFPHIQYIYIILLIRTTLDTCNDIYDNKYAIAIQVQYAVCMVFRY